MIYLGGPWQRFCADKYKDMIRERFPNQEFYDPEQYSGADWFKKSPDVLKSCNIMIVYMPPFQGFVLFQMGQYFTLNPTGSIIVIWPDNINQISKKIFENVATIVSSVDDAITEIQDLL